MFANASTYARCAGHHFFVVFAGKDGQYGAMKRLLIPHGLWAIACAAAWMAGSHFSAGTGQGGDGRPTIGRDAAGHVTATGHRGSPNAAEPGAPPAPGVDPASEAAGLILREPALAGKDFPSVIRSVLGEVDETVREQRFRLLLSRLTAADARAVQDIFVENDKIGRWFVPEYNAFVARWGQVDGAGATDYAVSHYHGDSHSGLMTRLVKGWAQTDPPAAVAWFNRQADLPAWMESASLRGIVEGYSLKDLPGAARMINERLDDPAAYDCLEPLMDRYVQGQGLDAAETWFNGLSASSTGNSIKTRFFPELLERYFRGGDPTVPMAAELVARHASEDWFPPSAVVGVMSRYLKVDRAKALQWAEQLPEGQAKAIARSFSGTPSDAE